MSYKNAKLPVLLKILRVLEFPKKLGVLDRMFGGGLSAMGICWVRTRGGLEWLLDLANPTHRWLVYGDYEGPALRRWAVRALGRGARLVVSGGNIGQEIVSLHPWLGFSEIHVFEPNNEAADWLESCVRRNGDLPVRLNRCGLGERDGEAFLVVPPSEITHGSQSFIAESGAGEVIRLTGLDGYWSGRRGRIDLWILDVEGFEYEALSGARRLLEGKQIGAVFMEVDTSDASRRAVRLLRELGYASYFLRENGRLSAAQSAEGHSNMLFLAR